MLNSVHANAIALVGCNVYNGLLFLYHIYWSVSANEKQFKCVWLLASIKHRSPLNHSSSSGSVYTCLMQVNNMRWNKKWSVELHKARGQHKKNPFRAGLTGKRLISKGLKGISNVFRDRERVFCLCCFINFVKHRGFSFCCFAAYCWCLTVS